MAPEVIELTGSSLQHLLNKTVKHFIAILDKNSIALRLPMCYNFHKF